MEANQNIIQQLQQTPKWKEFEEWYNQYLVDIDSHIVGNMVHLEDIEDDNQDDVYSGVPYGVNFCFLPSEFQRGLFEKFIEDEGLVIKIEGMFPKQHYYIFQDSRVLKKHKSFEKLLIWYFNN